MSVPLLSAEPISEDLLEMITAIHQFPTSADFAIWLTNNEFTHRVYENRLEEGKHKRTYQYDYKEIVFFQGKAEVDLSHFPMQTVQALTNKSLLSLENPVFDKIGKACISRMFADPYYTVISHGLYKTKVVGMVWEIYNLTPIPIIYKNKHRK